MSDFRLALDVQEQAPALQVSLSRVGVTNVEKVIRIGSNGTERLYWAKLDCFVDLGPLQKGAHMSRFEEAEIWHRTLAEVSVRSELDEKGMPAVLDECVSSATNLREARTTDG